MPAPKLILLGGPPGVGKNSVLPHVRELLPRSVTLDADEVYGVPLETFTEEMREGWIARVSDTLALTLQADCDFVFQSWVFENPELYNQILAGVEGLPGSCHFLYLVASPDALAARLNQRGQPDLVEYSIGKLRSIESRNPPMVDTTELDPPGVAQRIVDHVRSL